ncbi:unnamed protein product [Clonostachys solani]|uniref:Hemerythrin-like domain-containing protein n=1 Tax=Clonostachys solani TaxID=160281 RepID=A0A9P0EIN3_9HYPO|nr:unnamed protein product [Clonostachys solani]
MAVDNSNSIPQGSKDVYADHPFALITTPAYTLPSETKPNLFHNLATEMACVHNMIIRGLNSIYLQAQHVQPSDHYAFCNYAHQWCRYLNAHHSGEEQYYFPAIERLSGQEGLMSRNVDQHKVFHDGVEEFSLYVQGCLNKNTDFSGDELIRIIDTFSKALIEHLNGEIGTILGLEEFGEERMAEILDINAQAVGEVMKSQGMTTGLPFAIANLDLHFEGGIHANTFPPPEAAGPLFVIRHIGFWFHRDWWKFASCDRSGNMQRLYAVPK